MIRAGLIAFALIALKGTPADAAECRNITFDGKDPLPLLTANSRSPHESFFFEYRHYAALRKGDWKIVREQPDRPWQLFDLKDDVSESHDLAHDHPDKVAKLNKLFQSWKNKQ